MKQDRYDRTYELRVQIMKFAQKHPNCNPLQVQIALKEQFGMAIKYDIARNHMEAMAENGELSTFRQGRWMFFTAIKDSVMTADEMRLRSRQRREGTANEKQQAKAQPKGKEPWRTVHIGGHHAPIRNPDAMGSSGRPWGVQSSFSMV